MSVSSREPRGASQRYDGPNRDEDDRRTCRARDLHPRRGAFRPPPTCHPCAMGGSGIGFRNYVSSAPRQLPWGEERRGRTPAGRVGAKAGSGRGPSARGRATLPRPLRDQRDQGAVGPRSSHPPLGLGSGAESGTEPSPPAPSALCKSVPPSPFLVHPFWLLRRRDFGQEART